MTLQESPLKPQLYPLEDGGTEYVGSWASEAPLKLVAWALDSIGRTAKTTAIRERITSVVVPDLNWKTWWGRVLPAVKKSRYFSVRSNNSIRLMAKVADIPAQRWESLSPPAKGPRQKSLSVTDWRRWFLNPTSEPPPARWPTKPACNALAKLPAKDISLALGRTMWGAEEFLASGNPSAQAATAWLESVSRAFVRYRDLEDVKSISLRSQSVAKLLARLAKVAGFTSRATELLLWAGSFSGRPSVWQPEYMAGMWQAIQDAKDETPALLGALLTHVEPLSRSGLAKDLVIGALLGPDPAGKSFKLDRLLDHLSARERVHVILEVMVQAWAEKASNDGVQDCIASSRYVGRLPASSEQRLDLLVIAALLLTDGSGPIVSQASQEIGEALTNFSGYKKGPAWRGLLTEARRRFDALCLEHRNEMEDQQSHYEHQLEDGRREEEGLKRQMQSLRVQIAAGREESRLDIRQDMLTVIADTLQTLRQWQDGQERLAYHVEARLVLALLSGGAEEFGVVGEKVLYDPVHHQASTEVAVNSQVRVSVPGAIIRGELTGDRILMKALVVEV